MEKKRKNQILSELYQAGFSEPEAAEFLNDLAYTDQMLSENEVVVPEGLHSRVLQSALAAQSQSSKRYSVHRIRMIGSLAAMLLMVFGLAVYFAGNNQESKTNGSGGQVTTAVNSSNPFAHPSLIMDVLLERNSANSVDTFTLDAVSEFWEYPVMETENPTSEIGGDKNEILA